jgi:hypothetical protein
MASRGLIVGAPVVLDQRSNDGGIAPQLRSMNRIDSTLLGGLGR